MKRDLLAHLLAHGCKSLREGGNHSGWHHITSGRRSAVPRYNEINNHLARKICRDLGVSEPERF